LLESIPDLCELLLCYDETRGRESSVELFNYQAAQKLIGTAFVYRFLIVGMPSGLISGVIVASQSNSMLLGIHFGPTLHHRNYSGQIPHAHQVVGSTREGENPVHFTYPTMPHFPQRDRLQPAEAFFDPIPLPLTEGIAEMMRRHRSLRSEYSACNRSARNNFSEQSRSRPVLAYSLLNRGCRSLNA
jgi:hypothetical protein